MKQRRHPIIVIRDALLVSVVCTVVSVGVNAIRDDGIALVADQPYQILVPCPEPLGEVDPTLPADAVPVEDGTLVLDARDTEAFAAWHMPEARNIVFDWLDPITDETIEELAGSGARRILIYGDAGDPDSGHELARELAGRGLRNITYVEGGAPALRKQLGQGEAPAGEEVTP